MLLIIIQDYGGLTSIEVTYSNLNIDRNTDIRLFIGELYLKLERLKMIFMDKSIEYIKIKNMLVGEAIANRDFTPAVQQRLDEDTGEVKTDVVPKDRFYNVLLPGTRVKEIDPDSRHICIKKSS